MASKQALMQEIDTLPPNDIDEVSTFVSFLKFKKKQSDNTSQVSEKINTWAELDKLVSELTEDEKLSFDDFPRFDLGRPLITFDGV